MNKQKIFMIITIAIALVGVGSYFLLPDESAKNSLPTDIVFYYGDTCPHCKKVDEYVVQNNVQEKMPFVQKEVYNDEKNSAELAKIAEKCGMAADEVGVPFLWADQQCFVGDKDIIDYFSQKIETQQ